MSTEYERLKLGKVRILIEKTVLFFFTIYKNLLKEKNSFRTHPSYATLVLGKPFGRCLKKIEDVKYKGMINVHSKLAWKVITHGLISIFSKLADFLDKGNTVDLVYPGSKNI